MISSRWRHGPGAPTFATAANNDFCRVSAVAARRISLDRAPGGWTADAGVRKAIRTFLSDFLVNGMTKRSNTVERQYLDHVPITCEYMRAMTLDTLAIEAK
jgi:hypothetical protein